MVKIIKYTEYGDHVLYLPKHRAFDIWCNHYDSYLKRLYDIFYTSCIDNSVHWYNQIDFTTFCEFIYCNSRKDLCLL